MNTPPHDALRKPLGALAMLGVHAMSDEWSASLAVWSHGRATSVALAPRLLILVAAASSVGFTFSRRWRSWGALFCTTWAALYALAPVTYHNNLYALWLFVLAAVLTGGPSFAQHGAFQSLVRWQVVWVYLASVAVKLVHPFWQGTGATIRWLAFERVPATSQGFVNVLLAPLVAHDRIASLVDATTLVTEATVALLLLAPRWRHMGVVPGVVMHVSMQLWLSPQLFTFLMLWSYYAFVPSNDRTWTLTHAPSSRFDTAVAALTTHLDVLGRVATVEGETLTLTTPAKQIVHGARALVMLAALSPYGPVAFACLVLLAPGMRQVCTMPRDALEQIAVLLWASAWIPGLWDAPLRWVRRRV